MPALAIVNLTKRYVQRIPGYHFITLDGLRSVDEVPAKYQDDIDDEKLAVRVLPNERRRIAARPAYGRWAAMLEEDEVLPVVVITSPTSNPTYISGTATVSLAGTASDAAGLIEVTWASDYNAGSGTATGTSAWSIADIPLLEGGNTVIVVTARDASGNEGTDTITVSYPV